jgi:PAS domain S-box-containing protein
MRKFFNVKRPAFKSPSDSHIHGGINNKAITLNEKLEESELRYRRLFETAQDGILILDFATGTIVDANPFIINILDYPKEEIVGRRLWEIGLFSNMEESERAFAVLKSKGYIRFEDMPVQNRSGKITEVEFISNVYLVNKTKVIQCNIRDITDRKVAERALKESEQNLKKQNADYINLNKEYIIINERLNSSLSQIQKINKELIIAKAHAEESDKLKSSFLANIGHEIRTPLNAIMGFSEFLLDAGLSDEKREGYVQIIKGSSSQLLSVISDIIDISTIEVDQIEVDSELVNINDLLNELFVTYKKLVAVKKLSMRYSCGRPNELIQVKTDGNRIKQVLCNLLNNAIKFTKEGEIEFGYKIEKKFIEFYVKDCGIGIGPENHELIFQRFRKVANTNGQIYSGNGLGLSISKALVEKLGGIISVDSKLGSGSTFTFTIPYQKKTNAKVSPALTATHGELNMINEKTILIVEDEKNSYALIEEFLSGKNIKLIHAWDGGEAVEQVKKRNDISLVLMDIRMPVMDGYEATKLIKKISPNLPVIAQTAFAGNHDKAQALEAGFDNYISKPILRDTLVELITNYLN